MLDVIKRAIISLWPELESGHHLPRFAEVVAINDTPTQGVESSDWRPYYSVDIKLLKQNGKHDTTPIYKDVPIPVPAGNDEMGLFGFPQKGTWVTVSFAYGSPAHPVIINVLPHGRKMPNVPQNELLLQLTNKTFLRSTAAGNQRLVAAQKLHVGNGAINLLAEVRELAKQVKEHTHGGIAKGPDSTKVPDQASAFASIESKVNQITE